MNEKDLEMLTTLKEHAAKHGHYMLAATARKMEKELRKDLNEKFTEDILTGITNDAKKENIL